MTNNSIKLIFFAALTIIINNSCKVEYITHEKLAKNVLNSLINNNLATVLDMSLTKPEIVEICEVAQLDCKFIVLNENNQYKIAETRAEKEVGAERKQDELKQNITNCFNKARTLICSKINCNGKEDEFWQLAKFISFEVESKRSERLNLNNILVKFSYGNIERKIIIEAVETVSGWKVSENFYIES